MMGLIMLMFLAVYVLISIWVVRRVKTYARANGKSVTRWGWGAALGMYMLVFWDWIPTVVAHKYYCSTEAGFWVYKTPEQWKAENPGVMETLLENKNTSTSREGGMNNFVDTNNLNQRMNNILRKSGPYFINQWRWEQEIVDTKTDEVLARYLDFSTGNGNIGGEQPFRFWLQSKGCSGESAVNNSQFYNFRHQFLGRQE